MAQIMTIFGLETLISNAKTPNFAPALDNKIKAMRKPSSLYRDDQAT